MEKEFSTEWQAVLDALIRRLLNDAEKKVLELCTTACQSLANGLRQLGVDSGRLASMLNTANRSALSALKSAFHRMQVMAVGEDMLYVSRSYVLSSPHVLFSSIRFAA